MWTFSLPLKIFVSKNSDFSLNLNQYRNAHFQVLNKAKRNFESLAIGLIRGLPKLERCTLEYELFPGTAQLCDTNNICSIVDKFFSDALVEAGILPDDNYKYIFSSTFKFGRIDRENPRVDVTIRSPDHPIYEVPPEPLTREKSMNIKTVVLLTPEDVSQALATFVRSHMTVPENSDINMETLPTGEIQVVFVTKAPEKETKTRKTKLEPKAAMALLQGLPPEPDRQAFNPPEPVQATPVAPQVAEEKGHAEPLEKPVILAPTPTEPPTDAPEATETEGGPVPPKKPSIFGAFKRPQN
jgi:hypothetical protein